MTRTLAEEIEYQRRAVEEWKSNLTPDEVKKTIYGAIQGIAEREKITQQAATQVFNSQYPGLVEKLVREGMLKLFDHRPQQVNASLRQVLDDPTVTTRILARARREGVDFIEAAARELQGKQPNTGHLGLPVATGRK